MNFGLSEEQVLLKATIKRFLEEQCPTTRVRAIMESDSGHDSGLWKGLVDLGVTRLNIPAAYGGSGLELLDVALAAEELGYAATPGPFIGSAMATVALIEGGDAAMQQHWLDALATGDAIATVAWGEEQAEWTAERLQTTARGDRLSGRKLMVPAAQIADLLVVAARDAAGLGLWLVER